MNKIQASNRLHSYHEEGVLKHKYSNILTMLLRLRQLTAHIFLLQEVIEDIFELADVERLWDLTKPETNPDNPNKDIVQQMKKLIMAKGKRNNAGEADSVESPFPEEFDDLDEDGEPRGIIFKFRKYLRHLKETSKWGDLKDRSICWRCKDTPDDPYVVSNAQKISKQTILMLIYYNRPLVCTSSVRNALRQLHSKLPRRVKTILHVMSAVRFIQQYDNATV